MGLTPVTASVRTDSRVINPALPATFALPTADWKTGTTSTASNWSANDCDAANYNAQDVFGESENAVVLRSWRGVSACGPHPGSSGRVDEYIPNYPITSPVTYGSVQNMFQCTELVKRYMRLAYNANAISANGSQVAYNYSHSPYGYPDKFQFFVNDGSLPVYPQEGDVVSMTSSDSAGHVAIVTELNISDTPGDGYIMLMDQNGSTDGDFRLDILNYEVQDESAEDLLFHPTNWIHPLVGITNSPSTTLDTHILGVDSTSNISWIAGDERPSGYSPRSVTWNWDGDSWQKYNPPTVSGSSYNHYLHDITIDSQGDVWAAGEYLNGSTWYTLVYKWDPTNSVWVRKTSAYSGTSSYLYSVGDDGSGGIYAAGYYYQSGNKPLLLKWSGTTFANQNLALPQGVSAGTLTDITFSSSSNGWIAGSLGGYVYHFDGSSWTPVALQSGTHIEKVVTVSDSEAWGIGYYYTSPSWASHLFHYTTGSGWQEVSFSFPTGTRVRGISAEGTTNVWVVGSYSVSGVSQPYMMRFDGTSWSQVSTQVSTYGGYLTDVSIESGIIWGAGDYKATSSSTPYYPQILIK